MANVHIASSREKRQYFYRATVLHGDIVSDTLRDLVTKCLDDKHVHLKQHLGESTVKQTLEKYKYLCSEQFHTVKSQDPQLEQMDTSLLTVILLETLSDCFSKEVAKALRDIRSERNKLAHPVNAELDDDSVFKQTSFLLFIVAKVIDPSKKYTQIMQKKIVALEKEEIVHNYSNLERVKLNNELYVVKLVEAMEDDTVLGKDELMIRICLTKWHRQLSRGIHVPSFLKRLKEEDVINDTTKRHIEEGYSNEEQMHQLVLFVMNETNYNLRKLCSVLRELSPIMADLIENTNTDGKETEEYLKSYERDNIKRILIQGFLEVEGQYVTTEDVHIYVEEEFGVSLAFKAVKEYVLETFPKAKCEDGHLSFANISRRNPKCDQASDKDSPERFSNMTCEQFSDYVAGQMARARECLQLPFKKAIIEESITPTIFKEMSKDDMEEVFKPYVEVVTKFGYGIAKILIDIKFEISRFNNCVLQVTEKYEMLRQFDRCAENLKYHLGQVHCKPGNLLVPKHEFRCLSSTKYYSVHYLAKEVVRFVAACINGRKNGTIHFGIKHETSDIGTIIGMNIKEKEKYSLETVIGKATENCFRQYADIAFRCMRQPQIIPVEGGGNVIEVDVVPFSAYTPGYLISVYFPPKGTQTEHCFVYDPRQNCEIVPITGSNKSNVDEAYTSVFEERKNLEQLYCTNKDKDKLRIQQLKKMLAAGGNNVADDFVPIIVSGNISGSPEENYIRHHLGKNTAFLSARMIFDFDTSVKLRKTVENGKNIFDVKTADDIKPDTEFSTSSPTWVYCNGNTEIGKKEMTSKDWFEKRREGVTKAFDFLKQIIPKKRGKLLFLVYQANRDDEILLEMARMVLMSPFKERCLLIADRENLLQPIQRRFENIIGVSKIEQHFISGLDWEIICMSIRNVFRVMPSVVCRLPRCDGQFSEMTIKEKEEINATDIEIVSGTECVEEESKFSSEAAKEHRIKSQNRFYRGGQASWWNFYYTNQVGMRDHFEHHKRNIKEKLKGDEGEALIETYEIHHHPGAGGTTLGKHLLWYFSQFKATPTLDANKAYRCCIVQTSNFTEVTEQIAKIREFSDGKCPKPIIVLADNRNEEKELISKLRELAYKTGNPGKLFCLIIFIKRISITLADHEESEIPVLKHQLSQKEQDWFETKYKEMETKDIDVKTLLAFNLMRKSFDKDYMKQTTKNLMEVISQKEQEVLKCIALVSSYDMEAAVPLSIFDEFMESSSSDLKTPWGITHSLPELQRLQIANCSPWNTRISQAMSLLIIQKHSYEFYNSGSGVCILSQLLAQAVLQFLLEQQGLTLENVVDTVLDLVEKHFDEKDPHSRRFVKIICCLFKMRRQWLEGDRIEYIQSFSELVMKLMVVAENETEQDATERVIRVMQKCFIITNDGFVGQQLARFFNYIKDFEHAETVIKQSLEIYQQQSSYLWHTYGQIYKTKFESLLDIKKKKKRSIPDTAAVEIIGLAFQAIQKFREGQQVAIGLGEDTTWGFFQAEVRTALYLLENFYRFTCYTDHDSFLSFLNDDIFQVADGPLLKLSRKCEAVNCFRVGSENQRHIEESLRSLEERDYQIKRHMYVIYSDNETLLLGLRERFERYYGKSHSRSMYQFSFGIGLKPLMQAKEQEEPMLQRRVDEARNNLERGNPSAADERDLLVFLGYELILISGRAFQSSRQGITAVEYRRLLSYSNNLVSLQRKEASRKRLYLETFLYYAMLHWPLQSRTEFNLDVLAKPTFYEQVLKEWEEAYNNNFYIKTPEQNKGYRPKNYFALAKGPPGNDIIDLESVKREWKDRKKKTGRVRKPVFKDYFWREDFVEEKLERLEGLVHDSGHAVMHTAKYPDDTYTFKINTYYSCSHLSNRAVTFVLGFTWKGPTAFDVVEKGNCCTEENASTAVSGETETQMDQDPTVGTTVRSESDKSGDTDGATGVDLTQTKRKRRGKKDKKTRK